MSDLAPFVASVLYDRVLAETKQENDNLAEQLQKSRAVQIVSENGTVYAEAQFQEGYYSHNPNLWLVNFTEQLASCALSDLTNVQICIGGICKAHFGASSVAIIDRDEESTYMNGWGFINFCFGDQTGQCWLGMKVGPFPSEEAFFAQVDREDYIEAEDMAPYLTQELAVNHPELSVTFEHTAFFVNGVKGFIRNLNLDPAIEEEAQMRREELDGELAQRERDEELIEAIEEEVQIGRGRGPFYEAIEERIQRRRAELAAEFAAAAAAEAEAATDNGVDDGTDVEGDVEG
jgi:hypothetical protein